jgi:very-short-patch-repair endonuclease
MDVFELREKLVADYSSFVQGFINIRSQEIKDIVDDEFKNGLLWPDPLIQLSPCFEPGESIDDLVNSELLHPECTKIFQIKDSDKDPGKLLRLYSHQAESIKIAKQGHNYVLTTGTGSGKSLAYIVPIVDHVLRTGSGNGIKAIIVYPMNALANSQEGELTKFINYGYPDNQGPVTFRRYTGQESDSEKNEIRQNPPDILLTNYVMLELILTRPEEHPLVRTCGNLRFLVLDELHTYRGRQGADVSMLVRRTREATKAAEMLCVGTSATLAGGGTWDEQAKEVASVSSLIFGSEVKPEHIIGEKLQRTTREYDFTISDQLEKLRARAQSTSEADVRSFDTFCEDPLASWVESTFGVCSEPESGRLIRQTPRSITGIDGGSSELAALTGVEEDICTQAIKAILLSGYQIKNPQNDFPIFTFRLHQFISRGDTVYASPEQPANRHLTVQRQQYVPNEGRKRILLPVVFCRHCGHEFYTVIRLFDKEAGTFRYTPRDINERILDTEGDAGFLYQSDTDPWSKEPDIYAERLPDDWKDAKGKVISARKKYLPTVVQVTPLGQESSEGVSMAFLEAPFRFCLSCGVSYAFNQRSDFAKLSALGTEGRSTATTILSLSAVRHIKKMELPKTAQKLLSFTDNRQDASLQAGHFNDFIEVGLLRGALFSALKQSPIEGVRHAEITQKVFDALNLPFGDYSSNPEACKGLAKTETERALRNVLGYHLYRDLKRGWRVTAPNLEQTGLLKIDYMSLDDLAEDSSHWATAHPSLAAIPPEDRYNILRVLLDWMRRELAIKVTYLDQAEQERILQQSHQRLIPPWGFDESEQPRNLIHSAVLYPRPRQKGRDYGGDVFLSPRGGFGQYLRRQNTFQGYNQKLTMEETDQVIKDLFQGLVTYGIIEKVREPQNAEEVPGYPIVADAMVWKAGEGQHGCHDPIRQPTESEEGQPVNEFFREYYQFIATSTFGLYAREHTAQVPYNEREQREEAFREAQLPILYCSPTMELGIDIAQLNIVNMRNVPPTPANYAQRSGRAGRSGQPALVFTYCSSGSPHDQYFFKRPRRMVAGAVATPQIDLANEDLIRAHVYAIWLSEARLRLGTTLIEILDISGEEPTLNILPDVQSALDDFAIRNRASIRARKILGSIEEHLKEATWYTQDWLQEIMTHLPHYFEQACERWQGLYRSALRQQKVQNQIILDASRRNTDKDQAKRLRREAEAQLDLLTSSEAVVQSDFYSYRYFASEGFLPGYNFPRLPLSAFIPGRRVKGGRDEYLSRPRFLAITEFGPRSFVYHEGSRYIINQVILPARDEQQGPAIGQAKICSECGYLHTSDAKGYLEQCNTCEHCKAELGASIPNLFRMQNVVAKRRDQINCDEEERLRLGFNIKTTVRFALRSGQFSCRTAEVMVGDTCIAKLSYGDAATIWRINLGYRKRSKDEAPEGFWLDTERGYWSKRPDEDSDDEDPMSPSRIQVRPYVNDSKNCLLYEPLVEADEIVLTSLQAALKNAIQNCFELEDRELATESLPSRDTRRSILLYEAAEGGAGVLKQLLSTSKFQTVIRSALELCHFDPDTGGDLNRALLAREDCEAACYDCLMSYTNQMDHELLDRKHIQSMLMKLRDAEIIASASQLPRAEHLRRLKAVAGSKLEEKWLDHLEAANYALPTHAQELIEECGTRPDYMYKDKRVAVYIDGPPHDFPKQQQRDLEVNAALEDFGWHVIRFRHDDNWQEIIDKYPNLFGDGK